MEARAGIYSSIKVSEYKMHLERRKIKKKASVHALNDPLGNMVSLPLSVYENIVIFSTTILSYPSHL